jgi:hypothetical protein
MEHRILADENVERATINYLRKLDHGVEWKILDPELGCETLDGLQSRLDPGSEMVF